MTTLPTFEQTDRVDVIHAKLIQAVTDIATELSLLTDMVTNSVASMPVADLTALSDRVTKIHRHIYGE